MTLLAKIQFHRCRETILSIQGGDDIISTGAGNDTVYLSKGKYTVDLGAGNDTIYLSTEMSVIEGGNGTDTAVIRAFNGFVDVHVDLKSFRHILYQVRWLHRMVWI